MKMPVMVLGRLPCVVRRLGAAATFLENRIHLSVHKAPFSKHVLSFISPFQKSPWMASVRLCASVASSDRQLLGEMGEVRFDDPEDAEKAVQELDGSSLKGAQINVWMDPDSWRKDKVLVSGLQLGMGWQDLKDHFSPIGSVAFAEVPGDHKAGLRNGWLGVRGEVRFQSPSDANKAFETLNGAEFDGQTITVWLDPTSPDGTKVGVKGFREDTHWKDLKDFFRGVGPVAFCQVYR
eukprot:gnl/MRDRNA2_/MRDRNA2_48749_c0_seq1.p1 gnl/MRDRNA2_/MRDRNA2_48749_c0~~gnl/MRDRNA2_/MRDRNA2_48749_c0_seq1.p1  ORF type:complete len:236 (+),score=46.83 gnl/MRDRNA2_/MRDRNA2_48749_c0_seq1:37-744(+)